LRITLLFHFSDEPDPAAVTEVEGAVTDMMLPAPKDTICHTDRQGQRFRAIVIGRHFDYRFANGGEDLHGSITVTLSLDRMQTH
jgi:hypothetical protein